MSNSILCTPDDQDKPSRVRFVAPIPPISGSVRARLMAIEFGDEDAFDGVDPIDDPLFSFLTPAQASTYYRSRMDVFDPSPVVGVELA